MTNHWVDLRNTDCALIMGANAAENHPMSFKWLLRARETRGAKIISVDPRFTRSSAVADIWAPIRPGTDIAFVNGMIQYVLENRLYHEEYVREYTNASYIVTNAYAFEDGLFNGYDAAKRAYDKSQWAYDLDAAGIAKRDKTLTNPRCVFQLLKKHFARYDADTVSRITGCPKDKFLAVAAMFGATGAVDKAATILYAMGTTQHTVGTQNVRSFAILQLLLGNIGRPGGGIQAMRGESNVQGSTDAAMLFHLLPGYLRVTGTDMPTLADYKLKATPQTNDLDSVNYWKNTPKFITSLLKAWWGDAATPDNDFGYNWLPKIQAGSNHSHIAIFEAMYEGKIKGLILMGQNPAIGGPNANKERKALAKLEWMVAADVFETDTSVFWKGPGVNPKDIQTEVFLLPAAASTEKEGSVSNSSRWMQWRYIAAPAPGDAISDLDIIDKLYKKVKGLYAGSTDAKDQGLLSLKWDYGTHPDPHLVAKEMNGYDLNTGKLILNFTRLMDDGTTSCGSWVYSGSYNEDGNMAARRDASDPSGLGITPKWSWAWPVNRRTVYNRCSADPKGEPWDSTRAPFRWDSAAGAWVSFDVPDFVATVPPEKSAASPFIMRVEGVGCLFSREMNEGPFPEHYEPWETPVTNVMSSVQLNPAVRFWGEADNAKGSAAQYPLIGTTYRVTEHWQAGAMTRNIPWLAEAMPEMFVELSPQLAQQKGIKSGDTVKVVSARGEVEAKAMVTARFQPLTVDGQTQHVIGMPWHYGFSGYVTGGPKKLSYAANNLTAHIGDANTTIPEYKVFLCDLRKVT
jgi:formate dehydrogenase major subunit